MSEVERLTFMQYKKKMEESRLCVVSQFLRNVTLEKAVEVLEKTSITEETLPKYITRKYDGITIKTGHFRWHTEGKEDCHRYYYGKNIFASITINGIEYLLHYNKGDGEGVYINC